MLIAFAGCIAALLLLAAVGVAGNRSALLVRLVYGATGLVALLQAALALAWLLGGTPEPALSLPFGLPWLQAHFRLDALSAVFVLVVDGLAALVSLFAVGYGTTRLGATTPPDTDTRLLYP